MKLTRAFPVIVLIVAVPAALFSQDDATSAQPGALVRIYDIGRGVSSIPELAPGQMPNIARVIPTIDLRTDNGGFDPLADNFYTEVDAFLKIESKDNYHFRLMSDDGSRLWIDGRMVIDNDGLHGPAPKDAKVLLDAGTHTLKLRHFEAGGGEQLTLQWRRLVEPEFSEIPAALLSHDTRVSTAVAPGEKQIIPGLRHGLPGDGSPVAGVHPSLQHSDSISENFKLERPPVQVYLPIGETRPSNIAWVWPPPPISPGNWTNIVYFNRNALVGDVSSGELFRIQTEETGEFPDKFEYSSAVFRFSRGDAAGFARLAVGSNNVLQLIDADDKCVEAFAPADGDCFEMTAVRAMSNGLEIMFSQALDPRCGWEPQAYYIEQWPFDIKGGEAPRRDGVRYDVKSASVSDDRKTVFLEIPDLKESHVVYVRVLPPNYNDDDERVWGSEVWYTLNKLPVDRDGSVRPRPMGEPQNVLTDAEKAEGWRLLFDGKSTDQWRGFRKQEMPAAWTVVDGCLVLTGGGGDIITKDEFDDFELKLEWRISTAGNSGIFYNVKDDYDYVWRTGPEMQVLDNAEHADGRSPLTSAGSNYALIAPARDVTRPVGYFNEARIIVKGNHVEHWLNGEKLLEYELLSDAWQELVHASKFASMPHYGREAAGHIALQDHGDRVWYRNIKIRERP